MKRYGYLDMTDEYTDIDESEHTITVECTVCHAQRSIMLLGESLADFDPDADGIYRDELLDCCDCRTGDYA